MNIDIQRLIDHLHAGIPYHGDVTRDILDVLEYTQQVINEKQALESRIDEAIGNIATEDELDNHFGPVLDALMAARDTKLKQDKQEFILDGLARYHNAIDIMNNQHDYAISVLRGMT